MEEGGRCSINLLTKMEDPNPVDHEIRGDPEIPHAHEASCQVPRTDVKSIYFVRWLPQLSESAEKWMTNTLIKTTCAEITHDAVHLRTWTPW